MPTYEKVCKDLWFKYEVSMYGLPAMSCEYVMPSVLSDQHPVHELSGIWWWILRQLSNIEKTKDKTRQ